MSSTLYIGIWICWELTQRIKYLIEEHYKIASDNLHITKNESKIDKGKKEYSIDPFTHLCNVIQSFTGIIANSAILIGKRVQDRWNNLLWPQMREKWIKCNLIGTPQEIAAILNWKQTTGRNAETALYRNDLANNLRNMHCISTWKWSQRVLTYIKYAYRNPKNSSS